MVTRSQKVRLGVFLMLSGLSALGILGTLIGIRVGETFDHYSVRYRVTVSGLEVGAPVKYNGVRVGKVADIKVSPTDVSEVLVELDLAGGTPIKTDVRAVIKSVGITGLKYIEFTLGSNTAATIQPGAEIPAGESDIDFLTGKAQVISERIDILLGQLILLTRKENVDKIDKVLSDVAALSGEFEETLSHYKRRVDTILDEGDALMAEATLLARDLRETMGGFLAHGDRLVDDVARFLDPELARRVTDRADGLMRAVQAKVEGGAVEDVVRLVQRFTGRASQLVDNVNLTVLQSQDDINRTFSYLLETVENLNDFSQMLKDDPSVLIRGAEREEKKTR
jgi:phospholipid/cholesterol/gamma-HCH transport system substrate-binding protein